jgi:hypothetical protein
MMEFSYNGYSLIEYSDSDNAIGVVDTGTSLASVPKSIHDQLVSKWASEIGAS